MKKVHLLLAFTLSALCSAMAAFGQARSTASRAGDLQVGGGFTIANPTTSPTASAASTSTPTSTSAPPRASNSTSTSSTTPWHPGLRAHLRSSAGATSRHYGRVDALRQGPLRPRRLQLHPVASEPRLQHVRRRRRHRRRRPLAASTSAPTTSTSTGWASSSPASTPSSSPSAPLTTSAAGRPK